MFNFLDVHERTAEFLVGRCLRLRLLVDFIPGSIPFHSWLSKDYIPSSSTEYFFLKGKESNKQQPTTNNHPKLLKLHPKKKHDIFTQPTNQPTLEKTPKTPPPKLQKLRTSTYHRSVLLQSFWVLKHCVVNLHSRQHLPALILLKLTLELARWSVKQKNLRNAGGSVDTCLISCFLWILFMLSLGMVSSPSQKIMKHEKWGWLRAKKHLA